MDLLAYFLTQAVAATTPPNEAEAAARSRAAAIVQMMGAFDPRDGMEAMIACQYVMLQFLLNHAMRDASNTTLPPAIQAKHGAQVMAISRTMRQWIVQFDKGRKRAETRAKEAAQRQPAAAEPATPRVQDQKTPEPPIAPPRQPAAAEPVKSQPQVQKWPEPPVTPPRLPEPAHRPAIPTPPPAGRTAAASPAAMLAAAAGSPPRSQGPAAQGVPGGTP